MKLTELKNILPKISIIVNAVLKSARSEEAKRLKETAESIREKTEDQIQDNLEYAEEMEQEISKAVDLTIEACRPVFEVAGLELPMGRGNSLRLKAALEVEARRHM